MIFIDRKDAAQKLIPKLQEYKEKNQAIVIALPRGGVVLAYEISRELKLPLNLIISKKIGAPFNQEFAIGAITEYGEPFLDENMIKEYDISSQYIEQEIEKKLKEIDRRIKLYRKNLPPLNLQDKTVLLVDDGIATGTTMLATIKAVKEKNPKKIIVIIPVIAPNSILKIEKEVDQMIFLDASKSFGAVGEFYEHFEQVDDSEVIKLLKKVYGKIWKN